MEMEIEKENGVKEVTMLVDGPEKNCNESGTITREMKMKTKRGTASHKIGSLWICAGLRKKARSEPLVELEEIEK